MKIVSENIKIFILQAINLRGFHEYFDLEGKNSGNEIKDATKFGFDIRDKKMRI